MTTAVISSPIHRFGFPALATTSPAGICSSVELTGTAASDLGTTVIKNGKVDGDTVSEDQIDFTRQVADVATEKLVAKRVK